MGQVSGWVASDRANAELADRCAAIGSFKRVVVDIVQTRAICEDFTLATMNTQIPSLRFRSSMHLVKALRLLQEDGTYLCVKVILLEPWNG